MFCIFSAHDHLLVSSHDRDCGFLYSITYPRTMALYMRIEELREPFPLLPPVDPQEAHAHAVLYAPRPCTSLESTRRHLSCSTTR
jgi:hypothetical protein